MSRSIYCEPCGRKFESRKQNIPGEFCLVAWGQARRPFNCDFCDVAILFLEDCACITMGIGTPDKNSELWTKDAVRFPKNRFEVYITDPIQDEDGKWQCDVGISINGEMQREYESPKCDSESECRAAAEEFASWMGAEAKGQFEAHGVKTEPVIRNGEVVQ